MDRTNTETSAYSSTDWPKYEYLTKKDLEYKPNAFEQAKFEYSPLGKVFIDELDKSNKNKRLLRRLKDIEDKSDNQLLAIRDINRPAIKGKDNGGCKNSDNDDDDGDDDDDDNVDEDINRAYKIIVEEYKNNKIGYKDIKDELNKINEAFELYKKNKEYFKNIPRIKDRINKNKKFAKILEKIIDKIRKNEIRKKYESITKTSITDLSWINGPVLFNQINQDVTNRYHKGIHSSELLSIRSFLNNINDEYIKNIKDALEKFRDVKNNVKSESLKDIVKELERAIFGYDNEKSEERTFAPSKKIIRLWTKNIN